MMPIVWMLLGGARKLAGHVLGFARRYPLAVALIAALCLSLWLWRGREQARDERDAAREQVAAWKDANAKATAWALAEKRAKETAANDIRKTANDNRKLAQAAGAAAGDSYFRRNQCLRVADESLVERPDLRGADSLAGQPSRSEPDVDLVAVGRPDFNTCTSAVIDLGNARDWASALVAAGLAK